MESARECCERCESPCDKRLEISEDYPEFDKKEQAVTLFSAGYVAASWQLTWLGEVKQEKTEK